jgi:hypothetical protein
MSNRVGAGSLGGQLVVLKECGVVRVHVVFMLPYRVPI